MAWDKAEYVCAQEDESQEHAKAVQNSLEHNSSGIFQRKYCNLVEGLVYKSQKL